MKTRKKYEPAEADDCCAFPNRWKNSTDSRQLDSAVGRCTDRVPARADSCSSCENNDITHSGEHLRYICILEDSHDDAELQAVCVYLRMRKIKKGAQTFVMYKYSVYSREEVRN